MVFIKNIILVPTRIKILYEWNVVTLKSPLNIGALVN